MPQKYQISELNEDASLNNVLSTQIYIMDYFRFSETLKQWFCNDFSKIFNKKQIEWFISAWNFKELEVKYKIIICEYI